LIPDEVVGGFEAVQFEVVQVHVREIAVVSFDDDVVAVVVVVVVVVHPATHWCRGYTLGKNSLNNFFSK
jgi:hypothetical protein